jgi:hypothetical protein
VKRKPLKEIIASVRDAKNLLIVGCDGCSGIYQEGGQKQAELLSELIKIALKLHEKRDINIKTAVVLRQCDRQLCATSLHSNVNQDVTMLSMACGVGVQTLNEAFSNHTVIPALNTCFMGMKNREQDSFYEYCRGCGECILFETAGICPVTRCAKGIMNGPCGGCVDGKCEVPYEVTNDEGQFFTTVEKDCAWYMIYEKLKNKGRLEAFSKYRPPRNRAISGYPRRI